MINILTTRENRELSFKSVLSTFRMGPKSPVGYPSLRRLAQVRYYSNGKINNSYYPEGKALDPNWVTGLVNAEVYL